MGQWEDQIQANAAAIQLILDNAKRVPQLDALTPPFSLSGQIILYDDLGDVTGRITLAELITLVTVASQGWIWLGSYYVHKDAANVDDGNLEVNDVVYYKDVTYNATTITLVGWRYDGGDASLHASYTKVKSIA